LNGGCLLGIDILLEQLHEEAQLPPAIVTNDQVNLTCCLNSQIEASLKVFR
jgi:hypothetical protein